MKKRYKKKWKNKEENAEQKQFLPRIFSACVLLYKYTELAVVMERSLYGTLRKTRRSIVPTQLSQNMLLGADIALLPGDPGRVRSLAEAMGPTIDLTSHREYTSALAQVQDKPVLVCSTGMGGPSTAICLEELARLGIRRVIRVAPPAPSRRT